MLKRGGVVCSDLESRVTMNDGNSIPWMGLGVYQSKPGSETEDAVFAALREGYRHIDTAEYYENEESVGRAIQRFLSESGLPRSDLFITTKFNPEPVGKTAHDVRHSLQTSLSKLGLEYVDLYLLHAPVDKEHRKEQWVMMENLREEGLARSIGVSNFGIHHLKELFSYNRIKPVVNQVEINPYITRADLAAFCAEHDILVEAYSPLTKAKKLEDPKLVEIANKYHMTSAQVLIRWCLQKGYVVIPKSVHADRIRENSHAFSVNISAEDMHKLDGFDEYLVTGWDPTVDP